jgi:signal transduction histidine kinase
MKNQGILQKLSSRSSLRVRVSLTIVLPLIIILSVFTAIEYVRYRNTVLSHLSVIAALSGEVIENSLRHSMLESDFNEMQVLLDSIGETEDFQVVYLMNKSGKVIFAPRGEGVGTQLDNRLPDCQPCHALSPEMRPESVIVTNVQGERVFRSMQPVENSTECAQCHDPNEQIIGLLLTDIPMKPLESQLFVDFRENLLWGVTTILATVLIVNLAMRGMVVQRLERIVNVLANFGQGQLSLRLPAENPDEIGQLASAFNEMGKRIELEVAENQALSRKLERQSELRGELLKSLITAQEDERKRVARELHDELGQSLSALAMHTEASSQFISSNPDLAIKNLENTQELIQQTTDQMYDLILDLRPSALDDLGLVTALRSHLERVLSGTGIDYEFETCEMAGRLSPEMEICLYRVFQEALNNVIRHASANHIRVLLSRSNGFFAGEIVDDGKGFDLGAILNNSNSPKGLGVLGMYERIHQCGGSIEIISSQNHGTKVRLHIPIRESPHG